MSRGFKINGPCLVSITPGAHVNGNDNPNIPWVSGDLGHTTELGLTVGPVQVQPQVFHQDIRSDEHGPQGVGEVAAQLGSATIIMDLVHYDQDVLRTCIAESYGGGTPNQTLDNLLEGTMPGGAGMLLGNGFPLYMSGNHLIGLGMSSPTNGLPFFFPACHLVGTPATFPLGTEKTVARCVWRAILYAYPTASNPEVLTSGVELWTHTLL